MASGSSSRALARCTRSLWSVLERNPNACVGLQKRSVQAADTTGASLFHQVRSLVGSTRAELKDDIEDVPNMPRLSSSGTMGRRFYKKAHTKPAEDGSGYIVMLDDRELKTPARKPLKVPNAALALAIAAEWEWQVCSLRNALGFSDLQVSSIFFWCNAHLC